ncbi:MAG: hypothetical protein KAQ79_08810, partial [Cyclobacteriaceae bacterium]|nr:hypothetical protein [Cyclobacteriaceae bacterium]
SLFVLVTNLISSNESRIINERMMIWEKNRSVFAKMKPNTTQRTRMIKTRITVYMTNFHSFIWWCYGFIIIPIIQK